MRSINNMRSNVLTLRTVKREGESVLTLEGDTGASSLSTKKDDQNRPKISNFKAQIDLKQYIDEPISFISTLHDSRISSEIVMVNISLFPGASEGDVAELQVHNKKVLFIIKPLNEDLIRRKVQFSISTGLQRILGISTRTNIIAKLKDTEEVEADLVEIMTKDIHLSRGDMWILASFIRKTCVHKTQRLTFFETIRANVSLIYRNGKKVFSGYIGENTKVVFRSESARLFFLIQITEEMYHFQEDGEVMFHKVVNSLFPKIFKKWRERGTHHLITIVFAANVDFSDKSWTDLKQGQKPKHIKDYYRIVVDQVNIIHWNEIMISLRYEFANFRKGIVKQQLKDGKSSNRFLPSIKSDILNTVKLASTLVVDRLKDPDLRHTTNHFIVISAGNGLYDVDYNDLLDTGKRMFETELSVDIICLAQPPLHITPLFRYRDKVNDSLHHVIPGWIDVSYWAQENFRKLQWLPRCKIYELQMMGIMENEMNAIAVEPLQNSIFEKSITETMNKYDRACFEYTSKKSISQSLIWKASNLVAVTKTADVKPTSPTFSISKSAITSLQQIGRSKGDIDAESILSRSTSFGSSISRPNTSQSDRKPWMLGNPNVGYHQQQSQHQDQQHRQHQQHQYTVLSKQRISSEDVLKSIMWTEIENPSRKLSSETLRNLSVGKWQDVFPENVKRRNVKWRSLLSPSELPVMTPFFPTAEDFEQNYTFQTHTISLSADNEKYMNTRDLMRDIIHLRLMLGFQICYGETLKKIESKRPSQGNASLLMKYYVPDQNVEGSRIYLSLDEEIHRISCEYDGTINVQRYKRIHDSSLTSNNCNDILIRTRYQHNYHNYTPDPSVTEPRSANWNQYDQLLAGYDDDVDFDETQVNRIKFVLLPTDIPKSTYLTSSNDEQLTAEETRVEGLRRLILTFHRGVFNPDRTAKRTKEEIFPEINFYTGDLISFLKEQDTMNKFDTKVVENSSLKKTFSINEIERELLGPNGLKLQDRRWHWKVHRNCFRGLELVSWLIENFSDIDTREEGIAFGNQLMDNGLFEHVENRHKLLDGHYFYRMTCSISESQTEKTRSEVSSQYTRNKTFVLSRSLKFDLDPKRQSYKRELMTVHYDNVHNPNHCFHIRLEWLTTTPKAIDDAINSWSRMCERYGLKLVETPWNELCEIPRLNPFHSYVDITLAINPWEDPLFFSEDIIKVNKFYYHIYLLEYSGFLMDNRAFLFFMNERDEFEIKYSWGKPQFKYAQYIHQTGAYIAEIRDTGDLFLAPNNTHIARVNIGSQDQHLQQQQQQQSETPINILDSQRIMLEFRATCMDAKKLRIIFLQAKSQWSSMSTHGTSPLSPAPNEIV
ncbi:hypothetical protein WICMUC_000412 [Wickerhamomyces mucosus]|uniref:Vacuolar membrane-associated protein IML1 n=1 Tax=Wickerhamomyces mucosus TaxID=1378264 RepID=A0A9P8TIY1_9ASCO|nr:hypothetical protein WICMUC_000412 [Wickerhamomyces mucosus]